MGPALFGWPWMHVDSVPGGCAMRSSQSVGQSARSSPDNRNPGSVGGRGIPRPSPLFSPATRPLKSERPPLPSLILCSRSWTTNKRRSSRCSRGSGRSVGRQQHRVQGAVCGSKSSITAVACEWQSKGTISLLRGYTKMLCEKRHSR
jgi:hypothetical protein